MTRLVRCGGGPIAFVQRHRWKLACPSYSHELAMYSHSTVAARTAVNALVLVGPVVQVCAVPPA